MPVPSASRLLDAWEVGLTQGPVQRALTLLAAGSTESSGDDLAARPVGRRDRELAALRERLFGSRLPLIGRCPACGESVECVLSTAELKNAGTPEADTGEGIAEIDGYRIAYRPPTSADLLALAPGDPEALRGQLLARCVRVAHDVEAAVDADRLPSHVVAGLVEAMAQADPGADVTLDLTCPACAHRWDEALDVADVVWREVHAWAQRTVRDVHTLARSYGWREGDVLALSPARRQMYLELSQR